MSSVVIPPAYIVSTELVKISSLLPSNKKRSLLVHSLIKSLGFLHPHGPLDLVRPQPASLKELAQYHDRDYLNYIFSNDFRQISEDGQWGLQDDCPVFPGLPEYVSAIAGATLTAVKCLQQSTHNTAICWDGGRFSSPRYLTRISRYKPPGRHHARKSRASGFCYVADCVLALMTLRRPTVPSSPTTSPIHRPRVMYLDLDLHFSDGVSEAFHAPIRSNPPRVLTLSIHHTAPGFFPISRLSGLIPPDDDLFDPFTLSIPLNEGASNRTYAQIWPIVERVRDTFDPDYVVVQCGCDGLARDPCLKFNWSLGGGDGSMGWCVQRIVHEWTRKKLLLGGGGYNSPNAARAWAYLTSIAAGCPLDLDASIPDHDGFPLYAPSFTLDVAAGMMQDKNSDEYLGTIAEHYDYVISVMNDRLSHPVLNVGCSQ
ncbi:hypothetical protein APHAL10511_008364 [Amanita phalloides]|nr:hypothetical protein APHAL10511_008364 [Amanita phalloides]